jgi:hypothetical protein
MLVVRDTGVMALVIDHTGKDPERGLRDSTVKIGKGDLVLLTTGKTGETAGKLKVEKSRSGAARRSWEYELQVHAVIDPDGEPSSEISVHWKVEQLPPPMQAKAEAKASQQKAPNAIGAQRLLDCLNNILASDKAFDFQLGSTDIYTIDGHHSGFPTTVRAVDADDVWNEFLSWEPHEPVLSEGLSTDSKTDSKKRRVEAARKMWKRAQEHCIGHHLIGIFSKSDKTLMWRTAK